MQRLLLLQLTLLMIMHSASAQPDGSTPIDGSGNFVPDAEVLAATISICHLCGNYVEHCGCWLNTLASVPSLEIPPPSYIDPQDLQYEPPVAWSVEDTSNAATWQSEHHLQVPETLSYHRLLPSQDQQYQRSASEAGRPLLSLQTNVSHGQSLYPHSADGSNTSWSPASGNNGNRSLSAPPLSTGAKKRTSPKEGGFECDTCGKLYDRDCDLTRHRKKHIPRPFRPYKCGQCDEAFLYPKDRDRHTRTHEKDPSPEFFCPHQNCKAHATGFGRKDNYQRHMRNKHSGSSLRTNPSASSAASPDGHCYHE